MLSKPTWERCHIQLHTSQTIWQHMLQHLSFLKVKIAVFFFLDRSFSIHCQPYEAGSGRGNCCPLDVEAGRRTTNTDPYPAAEFHSDSKRWHWQRQRHLSVHISLSVSLKPCSPQLRWLASLSSPNVFLSLPPLNANLRLVRASTSLFKLMLQWDWPASPHMVQRMLSEPRIYN